MLRKQNWLFFYFILKDNNQEWVSISNEEVERDNNYKYLGIFFDENLTKDFSSWESCNSSMLTILCFIGFLDHAYIQSTHFVWLHGAVIAVRSRRVKLTLLSNDQVKSSMVSSCQVSRLYFFACATRKLFLSLRWLSSAF